MKLKTDDDLIELKPMSIRTRLEPGNDNEEKSIISEASINHIYEFFYTTNGLIIAIILVWAALFLQYASGKTGFIIGATNRLFQYNSIINSNKPANLRDLIRTTSLEATRTKSISTIPIDRYEIILDSNIQFVISVSNAANPTAVKDRVSNIEHSQPSQINHLTRSLGNSQDHNSSSKLVDPLDVNNMDKKLLVFDYQTAFDLPYSIVLNKFNTVPDHCLLVTNSFAPQITPLTGTDLSVWYTILDSINGVGFYNSNFLAGASQAHKHMQFIPLDETWKFRDVDALYGIPLDDIIMPNVENNKWKSFHCSAVSHRDSRGHRISYKSIKSRYIYTIPQFDFQHALAVLRVSGEFKTPQDHADYLQCVYERLLEYNGIEIDTLHSCSAASDRPLPPPVAAKSTQSDDDNNIYIANSKNTNSNNNKANKHTNKGEDDDGDGDRDADRRSRSRQLAVGQGLTIDKMKQLNLTVHNSGRFSRVSAHLRNMTLGLTNTTALLQVRSSIHNATAMHAQLMKSNLRSVASRFRNTTDSVGVPIMEALNHTVKHITHLNSTEVKQRIDLISEQRSKIAYGQRQIAHMKEKYSTGKKKTSTTTRVLKSSQPATIDCQHEGAYNLVLTSSYMLLIPRSEKSYEDINVNTFGYLGFMMASTQDKLDTIKSVTPLNILKAVSKSKE